MAATHADRWQIEYEKGFKMASCSRLHTSAAGKWSSKARLSAAALRKTILLLGMTLFFMLAFTLVQPARTILAQVADPTPVPTDDWARVQAEGRLVVGTSADYQPFEYYNSNFQLDGFDIALMQEIGERLDIEIVWNDFAFGGLLDALNLGQVDAAIGAISVTPDRADKVDFTSLYLSANDAVLVKTSSGIVVRSPSDFAGYSLAVERGTTYQAWAQQNLVDTGILAQNQLVPFESVDETISALQSDAVQMVLLGYAPAQVIDRRSAEITVGGTKFNTQQYAIATRNGSTLLNRLNSALAEVMTDGTWDALIKHYLSVDSAVVLPPPNEEGVQALVPTATPLATEAATAAATPAVATPEEAPAVPVTATLSAEAISTPTSTATSAPVVVPSATSTATPMPATATPAPPTPAPTTVVCTNGMGFVADVNLNDNNMTTPPVMSPGQGFTKTWRIANTGNCAWEADFMLLYVNGNRPEAQMNAQPVAIGRSVAPGEQVDISVNLVAPYTYGTFQAFFQMRDNKGIYFGQVIWAGVSVPDPTPPTPTPAPPTPVPANQAPNPNFRVDNPYITLGQCTALRWDVDNVSAVFFVDGGNSQGKGGHDAQTVCPGQTTTYELQVTATNGQVYSYYATVSVTGNSQGYSMNFSADRSSINRGECTDLRWNVQGVQAVYLDGQGVAGVSSTQVCPTQDTVYTLVAVKNDGSQDARQVRITVSGSGGSGGNGGNNGGNGGNNADGSSGPRIDWFKVDKNTVSNGGCVELSWRVSDASGVNINRSGTYILQGGGGHDKKKDCPPGPGMYEYTLEVYGHTGNSSQKLTVEVRP